MSELGAAEGRHCVEVASDLRPIAPEHRRKRGLCRDQRARRVNNLANPTKSAKPPPPVQIRAAPPILSHATVTSCRIGPLRAIRRFGNSWEQFALERFDRGAVRRVDDMRVYVECR